MNAHKMKPVVHMRSHYRHTQKVHGNYKHNQICPKSAPFANSFFVHFLLSVQEKKNEQFKTIMYYYKQTRKILLLLCLSYRDHKM